MVLDAPLRDELRKSGLVDKGGQIMEIGENVYKAALRGSLLKSLQTGLGQAYAAAQALVHLRSDNPDNPDMIDGVDIHEKAIEQAISLIHDSLVMTDNENTSEYPDNNGESVSDQLQSALMIAVMLKSDIFDKLDNQ